jgi:hypothetical protein
MQTSSLRALAAQHLTLARNTSSGHRAHTVKGDGEHAPRHTGPEDRRAERPSGGIGEIADDAAEGGPISALGARVLLGSDEPNGGEVTAATIVVNDHNVEVPKQYREPSGRPRYVGTSIWSCPYGDPPAGTVARFTARLAVRVRRIAPGK